MAILSPMLMTPTADGKTRVKFNVYLTGEAADAFLKVKAEQTGAKDGTLAAALIGEAIATREAKVKRRTR